MARKAPANEGIHTSAAEVEGRIIEMLHGGSGKRASAIGYAAYPGYTFRSPQGAAFAVQARLQSLVKKGVVGWHPDMGYYLKSRN